MGSGHGFQVDCEKKVSFYSENYYSASKNGLIYGFIMSSCLTMIENIKEGT